MSQQFLPVLTAAPGTVSTSLGIIPCSGEILSFDIQNTGTNALTAFEIQAKCHPSSPTFQSMVSGTNWANGGMVLNCSSGIATLGSNTAGFAHLNTYSLFQIQFFATVSSGSGGVSIYPKIGI